MNRGQGSGIRGQGAHTSEALWTRPVPSLTPDPRPPAPPMLQELQFALPTPAQSPGLTLVALRTPAVGIRATTAMFSVTNGVLLKPLPIEEQQRLVLIYMEAPRDNSLRPFAVRDLTALRERSRVFAGVAGVQYDGAFPYVMQDGD